MKMARADENDLKAALDVSRIIEDLKRGYMFCGVTGVGNEFGGLSDDRP